MSSSSIIYKNITLYRFFLNIIYSGKYNARFKHIIRLIAENDKEVVEYCFGDIRIAQYCKENKINWRGFDINDAFIDFAKKNNYNAIFQDINKLNVFPKADLSIMIGSLYHFHNNYNEIIVNMVDASKRVIISEPVVNFTSTKGFIGKIAGKLSNAGKGEESFRFNAETFETAISKISIEHNYKYSVISLNRDMTILIEK